MKLKNIIKEEFKKPSRKRLLNSLDDLRALFFRNNLNRLAKIYRTDKGIGHSYVQHYQNHFKGLRLKKIKLLEIGVGGYSFSHLGGNSLRMWKRFFPYGKIFSLDIYDKTSLQEHRIRIFKGSQVDPDFLERVVREMGSIDIIIDDGSHQNEHVITTFKLLFPKLKNRGWYIVEDTQTSYWENYGGDSEDLNNSKTMMNFFKSLTDSLNYKEFNKRDYSPSYFDKNIVAIHFYHNIIFIQKGINTEESNVLEKK
ncbi:class I SAM-dependent methyltransferase [Salegentibacter sp. F14]